MLKSRKTFHFDSPSNSSNNFFIILLVTPCSQFHFGAMNYFRPQTSCHGFEILYKNIFRYGDIFIQTHKFGGETDISRPSGQPILLQIHFLSHCLDRRLIEYGKGSSLIFFVCTQDHEVENVAVASDLIRNCQTPGLMDDRTSGVLEAMDREPARGKAHLAWVGPGQTQIIANLIG